MSTHAWEIKSALSFFIPNSIYFPFVLFASRTHTHKHTKEVKFIMKNDSIKVSEKNHINFLSQLTQFILIYVFYANNEAAV